MVKTVELGVEVLGYTAQALFDLVYSEGSADFLRRFHKELNGDPDAPAFIKRIVGKDVMRVEETQRRAPLPGGGWQLTSVPIPDMPGGAKFATEAVFSFRDMPASGGCLVHAVVTCSASGPYGLAGTIESFMAESAHKSLKDWFGFVVAQAQLPVAAAPAAAAAAPAAAIPAAAAAAAEDQFFDALELPPPLALPLPPVAAGRGPVPTGDGLRFEDAALLYLRYMCRTGDQTVGLLQALELHVRSLQEKVAQLQAAEEERRRNRRWLPQIPDTVSTRQALLGAALLASASATAALMYGRRQQLRHGVA